jgi:hypothetical protein
MAASRPDPAPTSRTFPGVAGAPYGSLSPSSGAGTSNGLMNLDTNM